MVDGTLELLALATSNPHFIFFFCNFIIAFLLVASNSTVRSSDDDIPTYPTPAMNAYSTAIETSKAKPFSVRISDQTSTPAADNSAAEAHLEGVSADQEDEDDDELRRRIEQFIDKINREWTAEKLRMGSASAIAI